ncbi:hypothetical protein ACFW6S_04300 [Streptomyces sp. NPDC058740]|uniref:hypothetical protein n=1 Tax=Streptomyces sp. NPDC058740 TaxID=3346619 RepID=UPI00368E5898
MSGVSRLEPVPAVALWSDQSIHIPTVCLDPAGIHHQGPENRFEDGLLWPQVAGTPTGAPRYAEVNPLLQRVAMEGLLCQIGMGPATRSPKGVLWLLHQPEGTRDDPVRDWAGGENVLDPPVCLFHARDAAGTCPELRRGHEAFWVGDSELVGVAGLYYPPDQAQPVDRTIPLDSPETRFLVATALIRELRNVSPVDLADPLLPVDPVPCNAQPDGAAPMKRCPARPSPFTSSPLDLN